MPRAVQVSHVVGALGSSALALGGVVEGLCPTCGRDVSGCEPAQPAPQGSQPPLSHPGGSSPASSRGGQEGLALPSTGQAGNELCHGARGGTHGDPGPGAQAGWPRHRAGRRCGSSSLLSPVEVQEKSLRSQVILSHPAPLQQCCSPRFWGQGTPSPLPARLSSTGVASLGDTQEEHPPALRIGAPTQPCPHATPETHMEGDTGLLQQVGFDGGPCDTCLAEADFDVLPKATTVIVPGCPCVPKGLEEKEGRRFNWPQISRCSREVQSLPPILQGWTDTATHQGYRPRGEQADPAGTPQLSPCRAWGPRGTHLHDGTGGQHLLLHAGVTQAAPNSGEVSHGVLGRCSFPCT